MHAVAQVQPVPGVAFLGGRGLVDALGGRRKGTLVISDQTRKYTFKTTVRHMKIKKKRVSFGTSHHNLQHRIFDRRLVEQGLTQEEKVKGAKGLTSHTQEHLSTIPAAALITSRSRQAP